MSRTSRAFAPPVPTMDTPVKRPVGRPRGIDGYSAGLADLICDRLARGESLMAICAEDGMPSQSMVYRWLDKYLNFREKYAHARALQCDTMADEAIQITRNGSAEMANANRVRLDAIKWFTSKVAPKKYGDMSVVKHEGDFNVNMDIRKQPEADIRAQIAAMAARIGAAGATDVVDESEGEGGDGDE